MALKLSNNEPYRKKLDFSERDQQFVQGLKTPSKGNQAVQNVAHQRLPLTPVNYSTGPVAKGQADFVPRSAVYKPTRLPGCETNKTVGKPLPGIENKMVSRDAKQKSVMDSAKLTSAKRPVVTKDRWAAPMGSAIRSSAKPDSRVKDSASQVRGGTRLFPAAPVPVSAKAPRVAPTPSCLPGGTLMRYGSVSRIPLPKATPNRAITTAQSVVSSMSRGSPPNRTLSLLDLTVVQQDQEPLVPTRRFNMEHTPLAASVRSMAGGSQSFLPVKPADISMSVPHGLNTDFDHTVLAGRELLKAKRVSVSTTQLSDSGNASYDKQVDGAVSCAKVLEATPTADVLAQRTPPVAFHELATPVAVIPPKVVTPTSTAEMQTDEDPKVQEIERMKLDLQRVETELTAVKQMNTERDARIAELERNVAEQRNMITLLEEYNDNCMSMMTEEQKKLEEFRGEAKRLANELQEVRSEKERLETQMACEQDASSQADAARRELDLERQEAAAAKRELTAALQKLELLQLESARLASAKDEQADTERRTVEALRGELENARRGAQAKYAELRAEVEGALAVRDAVRFELDKLQIAYAAAVADRDAALASAAARNKELSEAARRQSVALPRTDDELLRNVAVLKSDVERLNRENASLNEIVNNRIETIANEFDSLMRTIVSSNEDRERTMLERSAFGNALNVSMAMNSSRYVRAASGSSGITMEKLERLVSEQFAAQKQLAERDCLIGRLRDQLTTAEFSKEKTVRELRSLEKILLRVFRRLKHNVSSMNDECKQLVAELHLLLRDRDETFDEPLV